MNHPVLTPLEGKAIFDIAKPSVRSIGRPRIEELLGIVQKLHDGIQAAEERVDAASFLLNAFWLAASGKISEADIESNPRVSAQQREDLLAMTQLRYDAEAWRASAGHEVATALPTADIIAPTPVIASDEE